MSKCPLHLQCSRATITKFVLSVLLGTSCLTGAHADAGWFSAILVGKWREAKTGEQYRFRSDGSYTHLMGKRSGQRKGRLERILEYSGRWRTYNPNPATTDIEPDEWGLKLHALRRAVRSGTRRRTRRTNVGFTLRYRFPGPPDEPVKQILIDGKRFVRER